MQFNPMVKEKFQHDLISRILGLLPCYKGDWLLHSRLLSFLPQKSRIVNIAVGVDGRELFSVDFDIADPPQYTMVKRARYDLGSAFAIWSLLKQGDFFIDVGANHGYLSSIRAQKVGGNGLVISLEPSARAFRQLVRRQGANLFALNFAVSDSCGKDISVVDPFWRQSTSSHCTEGLGVRSVTVDDIYEKLNLPAVKFLKIDTEGMELAVLKGAKTLLTEQSPYVMLELESRHCDKYGHSTSDIRELMRNFGYCRHYFVDNVNASITLAENIEDAEVLFSKEELMPDTFVL